MRGQIKKPVFAAALLIFAMVAVPSLAVSPTRGSAPCWLSNDDALILLYLIPDAVSARAVGTDVDIEVEKATTTYPARDFVVATLVSRLPTDASVLGNGIMGTFVVDKRTGEVQSLADFTAIRGKELDRVRVWLLHARCAK